MRVIKADEIHNIQPGAVFSHSPSPHGMRYIVDAVFLKVCSGRHVNGDLCLASNGPHLHTRCSKWSSLSDEGLKGIYWLQFSEKKSEWPALGTKMNFAAGELTLESTWDGPCDGPLMCNGRRCNIRVRHAHVRATDGSLFWHSYEGVRSAVAPAGETWPWTLREQVQFFLRHPPRHLVSPNGHIDERLPIVLARLADPVENFTRANSYEELEKMAMQHMELLGGTPRNTFTKRVLRVK